MFLCIPTPASAEAPTLFHIPPSSWVGGEASRLVIQVNRDWELTRIWVAMRPLDGSADYRELPVERITGTTFSAEVPRELVQPPGVEYYIASEQDGHADPQIHFASPEDPQPIVVHGETAETRVADRLARHRGNRSELRLEGELTRYGSRYVDSSYDGSYQGLTNSGSDLYWLTRLDYTYRLLGLLYDIHFGVVLMRGNWATYTASDGSEVPVDVALGASEPGVNYGQGGIRLELHRNFSVDANLLLGASEDGFTAGAGATIRIGRIAGTCFEAGFELLKDVGHLGFFRFAWDTVERLPMAFVVEINDRPAGDNNPLAMHLMYELGVDIGDHMTITAHAGYAARTDAAQAGFVLGLATTVEF